MAVICPTINAYSLEDYQKQIERIVHVANRIQIDLTDGRFTDKESVKPKDVWWPVGFKADIHLMFKQPMAAAAQLVKHKPNLIIVQAEAGGDYKEVADLCHHHSVRCGVALLPETAVSKISRSLSSIDHVLIFSGNLGYQGGSTADLKLLSKAKELSAIKPALEIGWDGGINDQNVADLINGGIDVLNVGGYIQHANDPAKAFTALQRIADETGTT